MRTWKAVLLLAGSVVLLAGCEKPPTSPLNSSSAQQVRNSLLEVNGLANTLSLIDLSTGSVTPNLAPTGNIPNEVSYRNRRIYVVNSGANDIQVFSADNISLPPSVIDLGTGCNPWSLAFQDGNTGYCSCYLTNEVVKVDLAGLRVAARKSIPGGVGTYPEGLAVANGKLYTACSGPYPSYGDTVAVLDLSDFAGNSFTGITVHNNPQAMALDSSNRVHVVCSGNYSSIYGHVDVINSSNDSVVATVGGFDAGFYSPGLIDIAPFGKAFVAGWPGAFAYDASVVGSANVDVFDSDYSHGYLGVVYAGGNVYYSDFPNDQVREFNAYTLAPGRVFNVGHGPGTSIYVP